jgi:hypothetical protein
MRTLLFSACLALAWTAPALAKPVLQLTDRSLPLWEIRPLDRRVYVLTLEGTWERPPEPGEAYYIQLHFPDGQVASHRVVDEELFRKGEVRCLIQEYQAIQHGLKQGGLLTVSVSARRPSAAEVRVISNTLEIRAPLGRPILNQPPEVKKPTRPGAAAAPERIPPPGQWKRLPPPEEPKPPAETIPPPREDTEPGR